MKTKLTLTKPVLVFLSSCLAIGPLWAQSPEQGSQAQGQPVPAVAFKSENRALALSLVGTLVPYAVLAALSGGSGEGGAGAVRAIGWAGILGSLFGPSMGYFYAGANGRAWGGAGIRFLGLALVLGGFGVGYGSDNETLAAGLALAGAGIGLVSTVWDIAGVKKAVRKRNLEAAKTGVSIAPILSPKSKTFGLQVRLGF